MKIRINDKQQLMTEAAMEAARKRLAASLAKFGFHIMEVELLVNGERSSSGALENSCRVAVKIRKTGDVVVTAGDISLNKAISRGIARAERKVARRIEKRTINDRYRRSGFGFAWYN
jgi:hypothetical protein